MTDTLTPPEGQNSFTGIPSAQFVEDVDSYMQGEDSAEEKLKVSCIYLEPSFNTKNQYFFARFWMSAIKSISLWRRICKPEGGG